MAWFRITRRMLCAAAETAAAPVAKSRWERLKNSKAGVWCRSLLSDYKDACKDMVVGARERPLKASVYGTLLGGAWACFHTKPDWSSFEAVLLERSNQLALLSPWIRNGTSDGHVQNLVKLHNEGCLRHASLGLLSLVYRADYDPDTALYEARCSNLSVPWMELPRRLLDVGFVGHWWILDSKMKDFDVNEEEFKHLPAHMQATSPPSVQDVEMNERLHKESWLAVNVEDEAKETKTMEGNEDNVSGEKQVQNN
ncbi:mitochondrial import inner membrane translocase subunit Tim29 [Sphaeramia orbicularis]|uniref:Translocase of inner mitochondrial membrane 29 n=1 Tax=Sphaeramia orbicularis TaxID=375764 RepID=A0A672Z8U0_9TELE|nr:mitochondrial import inner membrane translocase subunit Tim29 [Sphaeramia orbicularis]